MINAICCTVIILNDRVFRSRALSIRTLSSRTSPTVTNVVPTVARKLDVPVTIIDVNHSSTLTTSRQGRDAHRDKNLKKSETSYIALY